LYHVLIRGNLRAEIFQKDEDFAALVQILHEGLEVHDVELDQVWLSAQQGKPLGDYAWLESAARPLNLESTIRPRCRSQVRIPK